MLSSAFCYDSPTFPSFSKAFHKLFDLFPFYPVISNDFLSFSGTSKTRPPVVVRAPWMGQNARWPWMSKTPKQGIQTAKARGLSQKHGLQESLL